LVSWNVIHYENSAEAMAAAVREYRRVLKPGGRLFISTTGPEHKILLNPRTVGPHLYQILRPDDHRRGHIFFYFDDEMTIRSFFEPHFEEVLVGRTHDHLFTEILDLFIITGVKGSS